VTWTTTEGSEQGETEGKSKRGRGARKNRDRAPVRGKEGDQREEETGTGGLKDNGIENLR
jgi:hypothetical protein